jgi:DNA-directed RNA polymerase subunit L
MDIKIEEHEKNKLVLNISGENDTLLNLIRDQMWKDNDVEAAGYNIDHPLTKRAKFVLVTKTKDSKKVFTNGINALIKANKNLIKQIK